MSRNSEFSVAQDPLDPSHIAVAVLDSDDEAGSRTCSVYISQDAGATWAVHTPPAFHNWRPTYDPSIAFDRQGGLHLVCIENGNSLGAFLYERSLDGGLTWDEVRYFPSGGDRSVIGDDGAGGLHACAAAGAPIVYYRSVDRGATWSEVEPPGIRSMCTDLLDGPGNVLYMVTTPEDTFPAVVPIRVSVSHDQGVTWAEPVTASTMRTHFDGPVCDPLRPVVEFSYAACVLAFAETHPEAPTFMAAQPAVNPVTGAFVMAHHQFENSQYYDLRFVRSTDEGVSFHNVSLPPGAEPCSDCHVTRPVLAYNPSGVLGLMWKTGDGLLGYDVWFAASIDDGDSWSEAVLLGSSEPTTGVYHPGSLTPDAERLAQGAQEFVDDGDPSNDAVGYVGSSLFLSLVDGVNGDGAHYWGMAATEGLFVPMWVDGFGGGKPQVWARQVSFVAV